MTEQEAGALAERLTRVWASEKFETPDGFSIRWGVTLTTRGPEFEFHYHIYGQFWLDYKGGDIVLSAQGVRKRPKSKPKLVQIGSLRRYRGGEIHCGTAIESMQQKQSDFEEFAAQWLPFFRRGCFLSGCAIEASAHEKMAWVEGFDRRLIESWNLKF